MAFKKHRAASRRRSSELIIKPGREINVCLENCGGRGRMEQVRLGREVLPDQMRGRGVLTMH